LNYPAGLFYYRESHGAEADLIVTSGETLTVVEAKSGATVSADMLDTVRTIRPTLSTRKPPEAILVYGGESKQRRPDAMILPWSAIHDRQW
jgi:hypothetical protein